MLIKNRFSIKELEALSGIKAHTLRIWEQRYDLVNPKRTATNIRYYDNEDLKLLLLISFLNRHGMKISKIANLNKDELRYKVEAMFEEESSYELQIDGLTLAMVELDEARFEKVFSRSVLQYGLEKSMEYIIFPFLQKTGVMWMTENIHPAQEHFISNLIRQKLIVAIDGQEPTFSDRSEKFLLFLPEGELHEISLLYVHYLLRKNGKRVIYLGHSVPVSDVQAVYELFHPHYTFTIVTTYPSASELKDYLRDLSKATLDGPILLAGNHLRKFEEHLPDNVHYIGNLQLIHDLLRSATFSALKKT